MTTTKVLASKLTVAFVAAAMVVSVFAPVAQAQTTEELQAMINDLLAQVAALQASTGQGATSVASGICPYTWTRSLSAGTEGGDVMKLQQFLNADADTRVAATGAGSVGAETMYFGPATAAAVSKFQVKYRADILSPVNLVNPTGFFGPSSIAKANSLCSGAPVVDGEETEEEEEEEDEDSVTLQGEATLDNFELADGETTVEEGDTDAVIGEITVEFRDGDASISRIDVTLDGAALAARPWDAFETLSLWVDGDMVAEIDADKKRSYLNENAGEIRFSGLNIVAMEDEELEILIGATIQGNVDTDEQTVWTLEVSSMRFFDADGVAETVSDPAGSDSAEFEIQEAGTDEEIKISLASSNPAASDIVVDTDTDTDDVTIMVADIEAEDNDIELTSVVVRVDTANGTTTDVVDTAYVVIDGQSFKAQSLGLLSNGKSQASSTNPNFVWYFFDIDGDVVIDEGDEVQMEVVIDFNDTNDGARYTNGVTVQASVTQTERNLWAAEGADDLGTSQFKGTAVGKVHTLVAEGILVPVDGFSSSVRTLGQNDTIGEFKLEFEVTAVEDDFYIT